MKKIPMTLQNNFKNLDEFSKVAEYKVNRKKKSYFYSLAMIN